MHKSTLTWRKGWFLSATFLLLVSTTMVSCKKKDHTIGGDLVDASELLESGAIDTFSLFTSTYYVDSVRSSNRFFGLLGSYQDPTFGYVNSEIYTQLQLFSPSPDFGDLNDITIDSVVMSLVYSGMYGSPGNQTVEVFEIGGTEVLSDTAVYYTDQTFPETGSDLVALGQSVYYMNPDLPTFIDTTEVEPQLRIKLDTNLGWQFLNESVNNPASFASNDAFVDYFKGIKIKTNNGAQASGKGGIFYFDMSDSDTKMTIYYKVNGVRSTYDFLITSTTPDFNHIDFIQGSKVQAVINNPALGQKEFYAQSFKSRAVLKIPGLANIPPNAIVHSATLTLPVSYQDGQPFEPGLDLSVALFKSSTDSTLISDGVTLGLFNVGTKQFTVDLRNYVQQIVSGNLENTGFVLSPLLFSNTMDRIIFNGPDTDNKMKPRFKIVYTEY